MSSSFLLHGLIEEVPLPEVLRFLHVARRTGVLIITSASVTGSIYFNLGTLIEVESQYLSGTDALDQIALFREGVFEWLNNVLPQNDWLKNFPTADLVQHLENKIHAGQNGALPEYQEVADEEPVSPRYEFNHTLEASTETPGAVQDETIFRDEILTKTDKLPDLDLARNESSIPHSLSGIKARELVQVFCLNGRSVRLTIVSELDVYGVIYIWRGRLYDAVFGDLIGDEAFYKMVLLQNPRMMVEELDDEPGVSVTSTWEHLLMEAAMKQDHELEGRAA